MERRGRAVVLGRSDRDRPAFLVFRTCFQLFELVASVHFPMTVCAPHFLAFRDSIDWASRSRLARRCEKSLSFWVRATSLPVHNGVRRGGAGTLWVRMASLRAFAPATFASSRRSGDASAPKTRCVATVARRGAASGRAESALLLARYATLRAAQPRPHSLEVKPAFRSALRLYTRAALAARFARAAPRRARARRGREASTFEIPTLPFRFQRNLDLRGPENKKPLSLPIDWPSAIPA